MDRNVNLIIILATASAKTAFQPCCEQARGHNLSLEHGGHLRWLHFPETAFRMGFLPHQVVTSEISCFGCRLFPMRMHLISHKLMHTTLTSIR